MELYLCLVVLQSTAVGLNALLPVLKQFRGLIMRGSKSYLHTIQRHTSTGAATY